MKRIKEKTPAIQTPLNTSEKLAALRKARKSKLDERTIRYRALMNNRFDGNALELLRNELNHLRSVEPKVTALARWILAEYEGSEGDPSGVKHAIDQLRKHCSGAIDFLSLNIPAITRLIEKIETTDRHDRLADCTAENRAMLDWIDVRGLTSGGRNFTDFAERVKHLEREVDKAAGRGLENEHSGGAEPVIPSRSRPPVEHEGRVITNIIDE